MGRPGTSIQPPSSPPGDWSLSDSYARTCPGKSCGGGERRSPTRPPRQERQQSVEAMTVVGPERQVQLFVRCLLSDGGSPWTPPRRREAGRARCSCRPGSSRSCADSSRGSVGSGSRSSRTRRYSSRRNAADFHPERPSGDSRGGSGGQGSIGITVFISCGTQP